MRGQRNIPNILQQDKSGKWRKAHRLGALILLGIVLSMVFGAGTPEASFALKTKECTIPPTNNTEQQVPTTQNVTGDQQECDFDQTAVSKVPAQPTPTVDIEISKVPAHRLPPELGQREQPKVVPTPEPTQPPVEPTMEPTTPPVVVQQPVSTSVDAIIADVFGPYAASARRVAMCESGLNPGATNTISIGGSHAAGLFQILYPSTWNTTSQAGASPYNARANSLAAYEIFVRDGYSWREWSCQP